MSDGYYKVREKECPYCHHLQGDYHDGDCLIYGMVLFAEIVKDRIDNKKK